MASTDFSDQHSSCSHIVITNEDVFFSDDDKEANLVELWAQNQCLYETTSEEYKDRSKRSQAYISVFITYILLLLLVYVI